jgi:multidrug efflux pump subunit AcrA (membrane-fusion protein)
MAVCAVALMLGVPACERASGQQKEARTGPAEAVEVSVAEARVQAAQRWIDVTGSLFGDEEVTISNKVPGRVIAVFKDVGDVAEPGEPLAQLLQNDFELARRQKESELAEVLAKLGVGAPPGDEYDVEQMPSVKRARIQAENAKSEYERGKILHDQEPKLISDQQFDALRTAWEVAASALDAERLLGRGLVKQASTRLVELAIATQALSDTTIRAPRLAYPAAGAGVLAPAMPPAGAATSTAPSPGVEASNRHVPQVPSATQPVESLNVGSSGSRRYRIAGRMASVGQLLSPVTPMFRLVDADPIKYRANVPERYQSLLRVGQRAEVRVEAYPMPFKGTVSRISPQIDPANRTLQVEVLVPNPDQRLAPGAFARGRLYTHADSGAVFVPPQSVVTFAGVSKVFVVEGGKAAERRVEMGGRLGDLVEITQGLKGGEQVVEQGAGRLAPGMPVRIKPATRPADGQPGGQPR